MKRRTVSILLVLVLILGLLPALPVQAAHTDHERFERPFNISNVETHWSIWGFTSYITYEIDGHMVDSRDMGTSYNLHAFKSMTPEDRLKVAKNYIDKSNREEQFGADGAVLMVKTVNDANGWTKKYEEVADRVEHKYCGELVEIYGKDNYDRIYNTLTAMGPNVIEIRNSSYDYSVRQYDASFPVESLVVNEKYSAIQRELEMGKRAYEACLRDSTIAREAAVKGTSQWMLEYICDNLINPEGLMNISSSTGPLLDVLQDQAADIGKNIYDNLVSDVTESNEVAQDIFSTSGALGLLMREKSAIRTAVLGKGTSLDDAAKIVTNLRMHAESSYELAKKHYEKAQKLQRELENEAGQLVETRNRRLDDLRADLEAICQPLREREPLRQAAFDTPPSEEYLSAVGNIVIYKIVVDEDGNEKEVVDSAATNAARREKAASLMADFLAANEAFFQTAFAAVQRAKDLEASAPEKPWGLSFAPDVTLPQALPDSELAVVEANARNAASTYYPRMIALRKQISQSAMDDLDLLLPQLQILCGQVKALEQLKGYLSEESRAALPALMDKLGLNIHDYNEPIALLFQYMYTLQEVATLEQQRDNIEICLAAVRKHSPAYKKKLQEERSRWINMAADYAEMDRKYRDTLSEIKSTTVELPDYVLAQNVQGGSGAPYWLGSYDNEPLRQALYRAEAEGEAAYDQTHGGRASLMGASLLEYDAQRAEAGIKARQDYLREQAQLLQTYYDKLEGLMIENQAARSCCINYTKQMQRYSRNGAPSVEELERFEMLPEGYTDPKSVNSWCEPTDAERANKEELRHLHAVGLLLADFRGSGRYTMVAVAERAYVQSHMREIQLAAAAGDTRTVESYIGAYRTAVANLQSSGQNFGSYCYCYSNVGTDQVVDFREDWEQLKQYCETLDSYVPVEDLQLQKPDQTQLEPDAPTLALQANFVPAQPTNSAVIWTSSNSKVASVDESGQVTAVSDGVVEITARAADSVATMDPNTGAVTWSPAPQTVKLDIGTGMAPLAALAQSGDLVLHNYGPAELPLYLDYEVQDGSVTAGITLVSCKPGSRLHFALYDGENHKLAETVLDGDTRQLTTPALLQDSDTAVLFGGEVIPETTSLQVRAAVPANGGRVRAELVLETADTQRQVAATASIPTEKPRQTHTLTVENGQVYGLTPVSSAEGLRTYDLKAGQTVQLQRDTRTDVSFNQWMEDTVPLPKGDRDKIVYLMPDRDVRVRADFANHLHDFALAGTAEGHRQTCKICGHAIGYPEPHSFGDWTVTREPVIGTPGERQRTCTACGYVETEPVIAQCDHPNQETWQWNAERHWKICSVCGEKINNSLHYMSNWTVITPATAEQEGLKVRRCLTCTYVELEVLPKVGPDHVHTYEGGLVVEAENGHRRICDTCGQPEDQVQPHDWDGYTQEPTEQQSGMQWRQCKICHAKEMVILPATNPDAHEHVYGHSMPQHDSTHHWQVCDICGQPGEKSPHNWSEWEEQPATALEPGRRTRYCSNCPAREQEILPALGLPAYTGAQPGVPVVKTLGETTAELEPVTVAGEQVEYGCSSSPEALPAGWQSEPQFTELKPGESCCFFVRVRFSESHLPGRPVAGTPVLPGGAAQSTITLEEGKVNLVIGTADLAGEKICWAASYDADGRFMGTETRTVPAGQQLFFWTPEAVQTGSVQRVFLVDPKHCPLAKAGNPG